MAILLDEEELHDRTRIYATDINEEVLRRRGGRDPAGPDAGVHAELRPGGWQGAFSEYYLASYDGAQFDRRCVENVVFAQHNLVSDRSFNEFHVIVCRNVMIYFDRALQDRVLSCSTTAWRCSASSASGQRRRCGTPRTPTLRGARRVESSYRKLAMTLRARS